ncbi:MAG: N,N-dimethylformamidase beta subunit family domain-containing protein [Pseudomonadota bacterium]
MTSEAPTPSATPRTRAKARHILDNYYIGPARDDHVLEVWGYSNEMSYAPGDEVALHVSTTAATWDLEIGRDGLTYEPVLTETGLSGQHHDTPAQCSVDGCDWPVAYRFTVPSHWQPGAYLVTLRAQRDGDRVEEHHLFVLRRAAADAPPPLVLVCATGTWLAYNCWGGSNHYEGITGANADAFAPSVSTQRPWTRGFCALPAGAPRAVPERPPLPGDMVRYPYMEWAYAYGYSKKYASAGWASYERHFVRWAEAQGYDLDIVTQHDLHRDPSLLARYACAVVVGHDEYWSAGMRDAVDHFVENGGRVARFAGNFLWQTRIEDEGKRQVCYKYDAERDPLFDSPDRSLLTTTWEAPPVNRPGALTFGVNALQGTYAGLGNCVGGGPGGFTVYRPDHWAFAHAQLGYGDLLGRQSRIFGYEVDGLDYRVDDGLPYPTGADGASTDIEILAMGLATNVEADHCVRGETLYIGTADAEFKARALHGEANPETVARSTRGNGVIVNWQRGQGEVFTAATCEWVAGLMRGDKQVEQVTRNVLDRFGTRQTDS